MGNKTKTNELFHDKIKNIEQPYNLALRHLSYQPRTVYEMQKFIKKKGFSEDIVIKIIELLLKNHYLDDKAFAKLFVESKVKYKAKSKFAFCYELKKKGISPSVIDSILINYNDHDLALKAVSLKTKTWQNLDDEKFKKKLMNFLQYRGFTYDISLSMLNHFRKLKESKNGN